MPYELYQNYISKINNYASQIVYVHLSEQYAPHAVDDLLAQVCDQSCTLPALKAATVEDLPPDTFSIFSRLNYVVSAFSFTTMLPAS